MSCGHTHNLIRLLFSSYNGCLQKLHPTGYLGWGCVAVSLWACSITSVVSDSL